MKNFVVNHFSASSMGLMNYPFERNNLPSVTVPGQTLTMRELIDRYVRGDNVTVFDGQYTDDDSVPDNLERMDELERIDLARDLSKFVEDTRQRIVSSRAKPEPESKPESKPEPKPETNSETKVEGSKAGS